MGHWGKMGHLAELRELKDVIKPNDSFYTVDPFDPTLPYSIKTAVSSFHESQNLIGLGVEKCLCSQRVQEQRKKLLIRWQNKYCIVLSTRRLKNRYLALSAVYVLEVCIPLLLDDYREVSVVQTEKIVSRILFSFYKRILILFLSMIFL